MVLSHGMFILVAIGIGFGSVGCSPSPSPEPEPSAIENNAQTQAEVPGQVKVGLQWWLDEAVVAELGLSDDQAQAIDDLMTTNRGDSSSLRPRERRLSVRYLRALNQEPYDAELVDRLGDDLVEILSSERRRRVDTVRGLRDILTLEQWTMLWKNAPQALQIGRFRVALGPKISVSDDDSSPTPTP